MPGFEGLPSVRATRSVRSVSSRRSGASRRLPSRSCGDLSQAMTPRRTKSAKNFRRGRKRVMVAAMNAKKPRGREKSYTYINEIYTLILIGSDRMLTC